MDGTKAYYPEAFNEDFNIRLFQDSTAEMTDLLYSCNIKQESESGVPLLIPNFTQCSNYGLSFTKDAGFSVGATDGMYTFSMQFSRDTFPLKGVKYRIQLEASSVTAATSVTKSFIIKVWNPVTIQAFQDAQDNTIYTYTIQEGTTSTDLKYSIQHVESATVGTITYQTAYSTPSWATINPTTGDLQIAPSVGDAQSQAYIMYVEPVSTNPNDYIQAKPLQITVTEAPPVTGTEGCLDPDAPENASMGINDLVDINDLPTCDATLPDDRAKMLKVKIKPGEEVESAPLNQKFKAIEEELKNKGYIQ